jgi:hypothetical protein
MGVAGLLILYLLVEGSPSLKAEGLWLLLGPLLGASVGASVGASLTNIFTRRRRLEEENERRRALATMLLSEICLLEQALYNIHHSPIPGESPVEWLQTATYDQAGTDRLLFSFETIQALTRFYQWVHDLRAVLPRSRTDPIDPAHHVHWQIRVRVQAAIRALATAFRRLQAEGGDPPPTPSIETARYPEVPELPTPVCEATDSWRRSQR